MIFPFKILLKKKIEALIDPSKTDKALDYLETMLKYYKIEKTERTPNKLTFKTSFFGWNWEYFALIEKGIFTIENGELAFEYFLFRGFVFTTVMLAYFFYITRSWFVICFFMLPFTVSWFHALIRNRRLLDHIAKDLEKI